MIEKITSVRIWLPENILVVSDEQTNGSYFDLAEDDAIFLRNELVAYFDQYLASATVTTPVCCDTGNGEPAVEN